ncbi:hypothetical protein PHO31112_04888 [Pandoraea horticolens]|uniref:Tetratricopeptide repeat protein n=2 Tax=Pandoraea horticolens TaxID=2508298 RepID=A0A5E4YYP4_9BURK|nr:hypothetical protein PHO31112_04888 [Pandoraea horticolens]
MWLAMVGVLGGAVSAGCSAPERRPSGPDYAALGGAAEVRGDWDGARRAFGQAVLVADQSGWPASQRAAIHFDFGRALGSLGRMEAARKVPYAYVELLDDYALALGGAGDAEAATRIIDRAAKIRAGLADAPPGQASSRTPYGTHCGQLAAGAR